MQTDSRTQVTDLLRSRGLKVTPLRVLLLTLLRKSSEPVGAPELFAATKAEGANYVTVYRTMKTLEESGLVRQVNLRHNHTDYEIADQNDHHHLVCRSCGRIEDFKGCDVDALAKKILGKSSAFAEISDHALEFFGTCNGCAKKTRRKA